MDIYGSIFNLCKARDISVRELEREVGFAQGTIKRWSTIVPGIDKLIRVADFLEVSVDELCGRMYYAEQFEKATDTALEGMLRFQSELNASRSPDSLSDDEVRIVRAFRSLSDADKVQFLFQILKFSDPKEENQ